MKSILEIMWKHYLFWGTFFLLLGMSIQVVKLVVDKDVGVQIAAGGFVCVIFGIWAMLVETAMEELE